MCVRTFVRIACNHNIAPNLIYTTLYDMQHCWEDYGERKEMKNELETCNDIIKSDVAR